MISLSIAFVYISVLLIGSCLYLCFSLVACHVLSNRAWVRLTVFDSSGYVNVIALGPEAENLIGLRAADMYRVFDQ